MQLRIDISPIVGSIVNQSIDEQSKPFLDEANNRIRAFMDNDNGLPYSSKLSIVASVMDEVNQAWGKKNERYQQRTAALQDWQTYASKYKELEAQQAVGKIGYDQFANEVSLLDLRYPGMSERTVKRGDAEKQALEFQQLAEAQRKLNEDAGVRAIANYKFTDETVKNLVASAFADPSTYNLLKNDPAFKDNPQFQQAIKGADRLQAYFKDENQVSLAQASAAVEFQK
jgi:hypothetical protein